ncbi:MAG: AsnC family transcriptional regulator [Cenarchaeum symbiont of Oopsacas minuta]|nr:AsnC family transcriptional regulator [Cenarchaeum symbiont of Oopsacas minuta]
MEIFVMHVGYVLVNCDLGAEEYVADEIRKIPQVSSTSLTFGAYDIVVKIHAIDQDEFDHAVAENMRSISRVVSIMTLNVTDLDVQS